MVEVVNPSSLLLDPEMMLRCIRDDDKFEAMIRDWQSVQIGKKYTRVEKLGGANDKGRDIACTGLTGELYIYQCKNYHRLLKLSDILPEIGKVCYYCYRGDYQIPKEYWFMSPMGLVNTVADLIHKPQELKSALKTHWPKMCQSKICAETIMLTPQLSTFIGAMNFALFDYYSPDRFIKEFQETPYFSHYFLQIIKPRPFVRPVSEEIDKRELPYIRKLLDAYSDYLGKNIDDCKKLQETDGTLFQDFKRQRQNFYSADCLAEYSREVYPRESLWFERVKDEFFEGIIDDIVAEDCKHGFERLRRVLKRATELKIGSGKLLDSAIMVQDRKGICHHLANERDEVVWTKKKEN